MKRLLFFFYLLILPLHGHPLSEVPSLYRGRFRPLEATSRLWLQELSHKQALEEPALSILWSLELDGPQSWSQVPLFYIDSAQVKKQLQLPQKQMRFTYEELSSSLGQTSQPIDQEFQQRLHQFQNFTLPSKKETHLSHPQQSRPLLGDHFLCLPDVQKPGHWLPLRTLLIDLPEPLSGSTVPIPNFTPYPQETFETIRSTYRSLFHPGAPRQEITQHLAHLLSQAYARHLAGKPYQKAAGKSLYYPSLWQLKLESSYYRYPLIPVALSLYLFAAIALAIGSRPLRILGGCSLIGAFLIHSLLLLLRCVILGRPPVANMFETVLYVPWISVFVSGILWWKLRNLWLPVCSSLVSIILLLLLQWTQLESSLENVQAVLDSNFWLSLHVLLIVGSYGVFVLAGILGHLFLLLSWKTPQNTPSLNKLGTVLKQCIYIGTAMIIPATLLGGVWAAQSWGRFWDWDPKESWAFISSCVYLLFIHAHYFGKIRFTGLAIGSIIGLLSISFTWYGVNYILGSGLHSYGFGNGGENYYYLFVVGELLFLLTSLIIPKPLAKSA